MPEFDVAVAPAGPQGIPTAGRVSRLGGGVGVVGGGECGPVVGATVVSGAEDAVTGAAVVAAGDGATVGGVADGCVTIVEVGAGALTTGGEMAVAGAGRAGGTVVTEDGVSTSVGVLRDSEAERRAMTPKMPPTATVRMARPSPAVCSRR